MKEFFFNNIALKLIALGLAIVTWFYVDGELKKRNFQPAHSVVAK